jgi:tetratricopeptide (TPR) repeat protein
MWPISTDGSAGCASAAVRAAFAALLLPLLAGCATRGQGPGAPDPAAIARYEGALRQLEGGDEARAESELQALAAGYPDQAGPAINLAKIRARRGELDAAEALLAQAVQACQRCAPAWNELGLVQRRQGRFAEAESSYRRAIAADAAYANAWFNLGVLYDLYLQRPDLALDHYERFRELQAADPQGEEVDKWIADLKRRAQGVQRSARVEDVS